MPFGTAPPSRQGTSAIMLPMRLLLLMAGAVSMSHGAAAAAADVCEAAPFRTLSLDCAARCKGGESCVAFNASDVSPCDYYETSPRARCVAAPGARGCDVICFKPYENDPRVFKFYIAFNSSRATKAPGQKNETQMNADLDMAGDVPYETNEFVRRIGRLNIPPDITQVVIAGGRNTEGTRGTVVSVEIDPTTFANASNVTSVSLLNMDLSGLTNPDIAALLPQRLLALDLSNTKLANVPSSLQRLSLLETLALKKNQLVAFPQSLNLTALRTLQLRENDLSSFMTVMTSIELLDLVGNKLTMFPYDVLTWPNLHTLHVERNPEMAKVVFTKDHMAKLGTLEAFSMDSSALDGSSCSTADLQLLPPNRNVSVCVLSEKDWLKYQAQLGGSVLKVGSASSSSWFAGNTVKIALLLMSFGAAALAAAIAWRKCRTKRTKSLDTSSTDDVTDPDVHSNDNQFEKLVTSKARDVTRKLQVDRQFSGSSTGSSPRKRYTLHSDDLLLSRRMKIDHIEDLRVIGSGGFAIVWLVRHLPQNRLLASKRLIKDQVTRQKTMDFVVEIKLNMQLEHPSIVQLVGVAWTIETDLQALLEYMPNGDLRTLLETTAPTPWDALKLQLAIDIIEALVYVHSFSPPLVHRDLKSRNVLLADDMKAKLCDFGVSRFASENNTMTTAVGTGKWLAPEVVAGSKSYDQSCDVYAFGVVLTELDTHQLPYENAMGQHGDSLPDVAVLQLVSSGDLQPDLSASCPDEIRDIALKCLAFAPTDRPRTLQVAHWLRTIRQRRILQESHDAPVVE